MSRILVITNFYPPHGYGGYEALCEAAVAQWRAMGHQVAVLSSDLRRPDVADGAGDPSVRRDLPVYWKDHRLLHPPVWERARFERRSARVVRDVLDEVQPDVVSLWNHAALSFGILDYVADRGVPLVAVIGDRWLTFGPEADAWCRMFWTRGLLGRVLGRVFTGLTGLATVPRTRYDMTVLFASHYLADVTARTSPFRFARTAVVPHGVDLEAFPVVDRPERDWSGRLLVVSRLHPTKGVGTAIHALARLPGTTLRVAGAEDETHRRDLEHLATRLGCADRVHFLGQCDRATVRSLYLESDALLFPSEWEEPFGIVPLEAMACGTPVIGTGTGGSGEFLLDRETCLRFPPGDADALSEAVGLLAGDPELRRALRVAGQEMATTLSQERALVRLEAWHVDAAAGFGQGERSRRTA